MARRAFSLGQNSAEKEEHKTEDIQKDKGQGEERDDSAGRSERSHVPVLEGMDKTKTDASRMKNQRQNGKAYQVEQEKSPIVIAKGKDKSQRNQGHANSIQDQGSNVETVISFRHCQFHPF